MTPNSSARGWNLRIGPPGGDEAYDRINTTLDRICDDIQKEVEKNPQLFMSDAEGGCYETLRELGCYSPIVHLQQTNGALSAHLPFTESENVKGIITGEKVLRALKASYDRTAGSSMPKRAETIYLTLEIFSGTTSIMPDVLDDCRKSAEYWRQYIPEDGLPLDQLVGRLD